MTDSVLASIDWSCAAIVWLLAGHAVWLVVTDWDHLAMRVKRWRRR